MPLLRRENRRYQLQRRANALQFRGGARQDRTAAPEAVKEFERRLRVSDLVIKFLTVRIDETLKRLEKRKRSRDKRAHRKATAAPAPAQPSVAQQMLGEPAPVE